MSLPHSLSDYVIRDVTDPWDLRELEGVQVAAWGYADRDVTPGTLLRVSSVMGGVVLGAYPAQAGEGEGGGGAVGLAYGFPALRDGEVWHHSHLLALRPGARRSGLAVALKLAQRERALAQGLTRMTWTFDPLVPRNARLNFGKLGAVSRRYLPDWYALGENRETAFPADRLLVEWDLTRPHAERPAPPPRGELALAAQGTEPGPPRLELRGAQLLAEVPVHPQPAPVQLAWRLALRETLTAYLARGYVVTDLAREGERAFYILEK
ncbi:Predicted acetyltransferase, GNAT superfamily [Deinococcus reticulitermitis]|uniref:Predicted acetyltransferase, GNAT superfamily n=1 Tax=Deinococcus reticulitermitis TaxID=856736 RepID=A0A1H6UHJ3_9DEIO|nr:acyl-CoA acyltransferase [Deinococcus reticulitermitis]SEI91798.1 Predicted acetyltransferase, GNAT superfamily [Deinococcus reticulitermitis]